MEMQFRIATISDKDAVGRLLSASYTTLLASSYPAELLVRALPMMIVPQDLLLQSGRYLVAETSDADLISAGGWTKEAPGRGPATPGLGHVRHVATDPEWVGRGLGSALVTQLLADAGASGMSRMEVWSTLNARDFYARCGFDEIGGFEVAMGGGLMLPSIRMVADI